MPSRFVPDGIDPQEIRKAATPALDIRSQLRIPAGARWP